MNVTDQLKEIVDSVARSGALTPEAIRQFDDLRKRATELEASLEKRTQERDAHRQRLDETQAEARRLTESLALQTKRAEAAEGKNRAAEDAILRAGYEQSARAEMRSILSDVFRNAEVQRMVSKNVSHSAPPQYPGGMPTVAYATDTHTESETSK